MQRNEFNQEASIVDNMPTSVTRRGQDAGMSFVEITRFLKFVGGTAVIVVVGLGIWSARGALPFLGVLIVLVIIVLILCGMAIAVVATLRYATRAEFYPVDESGAYLRNALGRVQPLAPMVAAPARVNTKTAKVEIVPEVPTLFDLIEAGDIEPGKMDMVMGYDALQLKKGILQLIIGPWPGTHAIAGRGRSGKTRRVISEIAQALIAGARVIVCDPHKTKSDGLAKTLEPMGKYLTIARGEEAIIEAARDFLTEMNARIDNEGYPCTPWLIVFDEWSKLMNTSNDKVDDDGRLLLTEVAMRCSTEFAGYLGYCCIIGQIWTNEYCGGTEVRRSLQSVFVHQLSAEYAGFFFRAGKWKNRAEELKRRECIFKDVDNQVCEVVTMGVPDDTAARVAVYLASLGIPAIDAPATVPTLPLYQERPRLGDQLVAERYMIAAPVLPLPTQDVQTEHIPVYNSTVSEPQIAVNALAEQDYSGETETAPGEPTTLQGESFTAQVKEISYTREQETAILKAAFQLARESNGRVTRSDIKERLGWNNKQYPVIKAVCDKHDIAKQ